jgi:hypothetical protein
LQLSHALAVFFILSSSLPANANLTTNSKIIPSIIQVSHKYAACLLSHRRISPPANPRPFAEVSKMTFVNPATAAVEWVGTAVEVWRVSTVWLGLDSSLIWLALMVVVVLLLFFVLFVGV